MSEAFPDPFAIARIDEATCIGCALCVQVCPTDAIVGAAKLMHTVIADRCTGCKLCLPPCPVDCIAMLPAARLWNSADAQRAQQHASARNARVAAARRTRERQMTSQVALESAPLDTARQHRRAAVDAALARARARRVSRNLSGG